MRAKLKIHPLPEEYQYLHFDRKLPNPEPEPIAEIVNDRMPVCKDGLYGFVDSYGKEVVPCMYKSISIFLREMSLVLGTNDLYGYVNMNGYETPCIYDYAEPFSYAGGNKWARVYLDGKWGTVGEKGQLENCRFDEIEGNAVKLGDKWGLLDRDGYIGVPCIYDALGDIHGNTVAVQQDDKWSLLHTSGRIFAAPVYDSMVLLGDFFIAHKGDVGALFLSSGTLLLEEKGLNGQNFAERLLTQNKEIPFTVHTEEGYAVLRAVKSDTDCVTWEVTERRRDLGSKDSHGPFPCDFYDEIKEPALLIKGEATDSYYWQERREGLGHFMFGLVDKKGEEVLPTEYRWLRMSEGWNGPRGYTAWKDGRWYFIEMKIEVIPSTPASAY